MGSLKLQVQVPYLVEKVESILPSPDYIELELHIKVHNMYRGLYLPVHSMHVEFFFTMCGIPDVWDYFP